VGVHSEIVGTRLGWWDRDPGTERLTLYHNERLQQQCDAAKGRDASRDYVRMNSSGGADETD
jgi:hypothetical protein